MRLWQPYSHECSSCHSTSNGWNISIWFQMHRAWTIQMAQDRLFCLEHPVRNNNGHTTKPRKLTAAWNTFYPIVKLIMSSCWKIPINSQALLSILHTGGWIPRNCERRVSDPIWTVNFTKFHRLVSVSPDELNRPNIFQDNSRSTITKCRWNIPKIDRSSSHHYSTLCCHLVLGIDSESLLVVFSFTAIFFWFHVIHTDCTYWFDFRVSVTQ